MNTDSRQLAVLMIAAFGAATPLSAAAVNQVSYASLTGTGLIDFEALPHVGDAGQNYDAIFEADGTDFAERFVGQVLTYDGDFDVLSQTPTGPLTLQAGAAGQNIDLLDYTPGGNVLTGLGHLGYPDFSAIGEGAFTLLFDFDQAEFGFRVVGGNSGTATVDFYKRNGTLIDTVGLTGLSDGYYGFSREGGITDIAGVSIYNLDGGGIGFDDIKHTKQGVIGHPTPDVGSTLALFGLGLAGLAGLRRRQ